jgi:hypothetical protein
MKQIYTVEVDQYHRQHWYQNDKLHRLDGPAVTLADGTQYWYHNGELHRTDGPAIITPQGQECWYQNGEELTQSEFEARSKPCFGKKVLVDGVEYTLS